MAFKKFWLRFTELVSLYWKEKESRRDKVWVVTILLLTVVNVFMTVQFNVWKNAFYTALQNYNLSEAMWQILSFLKLAIIYILVSVLIFYLKQIVILHWRKYMSILFVEEWLDKYRYYYLNLMETQADNPDQRISEDIRSFIDSTLKFSIGLFESILTFISFVTILWSLSGIISFSLLGRTIILHGYIVCIALAYAIVGTYITHRIGSRLSKLNYIQQKREADFRFSLIRARENAENIALYRGEVWEKALLLEKLRKLLENFFLIVRKEKTLNGIKAGYLIMAQIVPVLVAVPLYMKKTIALGGLMQSASAFVKVQVSLSYFLILYSSFAEWHAVINRLFDFRKHMQIVERKNKSICKQRIFKPENKVILENFSLQKPDGEILLQNISFSLNQGERVFIEGDNGVGKSSFLRCLAGIWPFFSGTIFIPEMKRMMFIPQNTYLPQGTLKSVILYPKREETQFAIAYKLMHQLGLQYLLDKLNKEADWTNILSPGEKQKISFIRVCLAKPEWIFLDEATSGMDRESQEKAHKILTRYCEGSTIVVVDHHGFLENYYPKKILIKDKTIQQECGNLTSILTT